MQQLQEGIYDEISSYIMMEITYKLALLINILFEYLLSICGIIQNQSTATHFKDGTNDKWLVYFRINFCYQISYSLDKGYSCDKIITDTHLINILEIIKEFQKIKSDFTFW